MITIPELQQQGESPLGSPSCSALPLVLDACCGSRMFWFDKADDRALFMDIRSGEYTINRKGRSPVVVRPDVVADFAAMPFADSSFRLVVFDPPHFESFGESGTMAKTYGVLREGWRETLRAGFGECFRVLQDGGVLVFKWCEWEIPINEVLSLTQEKPLFGHRSGKAARTHWVTFIKQNAKGQGHLPAAQGVANKEDVNGG